MGCCELALFFFPFYVDHCLSAVFASFYLWNVSSREVGEGSFWGNFTFLHRSICEQEGLVGIASKNSFVGRFVGL